MIQLKVPVRKEAIIKWINALRSGKYKQTKKTLHDAEGYCCLGVACDIFLKKKSLSATGYIYGQVPSDQTSSPKWLKIINSDTRLLGVQLSVLNDHGISIQTLNDLGASGQGHEILEPFTFDEIADLLQLVYLEQALD